MRAKRRKVRTGNEEGISEGPDDAVYCEDVDLEVVMMDSGGIGVYLERFHCYSFE